MTKLPLYASAAALALIAAAWSTPGVAAQFGLYTPIPKDQTRTPAYDIQHTSNAPQSDSKRFGLYTPIPPTASGSTAGSRSIARAPTMRTDPADPNHEPINP